MNLIKSIKDFFTGSKRAQQYAQQLDAIDNVIRDGTVRGGIAKVILKNDREQLVMYLIRQLDRIDEISKSNRKPTL